MARIRRAFRRSNVILRSLSSNHFRLQLLINQLKKTRDLSKAVVSAQEYSNKDLVKWAEGEDNLGIKDTVVQIGELLGHYNEIQKNFTDQLKEFQQQFQLILEGEQKVDSAKKKLKSAETKESKLRQNLSQAVKQTSPEIDIGALEIKINKAVADKNLAKTHLTDCENDQVVEKMVRLKTGFTKWSESNQLMATKLHIVFSGIQEIAKLIPDVTQSGAVQNFRFCEASTALRISLGIEDEMEALNVNGSNWDLPPTYGETQPPTNPHTKRLQGDSSASNN